MTYTLKIHFHFGTSVHLPNVSRLQWLYSQGHINILERVKINFLTKCGFVSGGERSLAKNDKQIRKARKSPQRNRYYTFLLTEGIYFIDSLLTVPGRTCLIMDEWLRGINLFSGTETLLSMVSLSKRWLFPWCNETVRPSHVIGNSMASISVPLFYSQHEEASKCSKMVATSVEFHYHFFLYNFSIILINATHQYVTTIKKNC